MRREVVNAAEKTAECTLFFSKSFWEKHTLPDLNSLVRIGEKLGEKVSTVLTPIADSEKSFRFHTFAEALVREILAAFPENVISDFLLFLEFSLLGLPLLLREEFWVFRTLPEFM